MGDVNTYSALCGWKFYLCNTRNARSYAIPEGLVTRDPPPISCSLRYPAKTERRHNSRGATISLGALFKLSSLFTKWGEMRVFFKMPKRSNRRYHFDRIGRSFRFSSIWIRNTYVPRWTYCRVRASSANGQNRAAVWHLLPTGGRECGAVHERGLQLRQRVKFSCHTVHIAL